MRLELYQNSITNIVTGAGSYGDGQSSYRLHGAYCNHPLRQADLANNPAINLILSKYADGWSDKQFFVKDRKGRENPRLTIRLREILAEIRDCDYYSLIYGGAALILESGEWFAVGADELHPIDQTYQTYQYTGAYTQSPRQYSADQIVKIDGKIRLTRRQRQFNRGWNGSFVDQLEKAVTDVESARYEILDSLRKANMLGIGLKDFASLGCNAETAREVTTFLADLTEAINRANLFPYDKELQSPSFLTRNLSGLAEIYAKAIDNLVAVSGIPYSILMGMRAKSGLGSDQDESLSWYKTVDEHVERRILPTAIACMRLEGILPNGSTVEYDSLYSEDEKKVAEVEHVNVQSNKLRVETVLSLAASGLVVMDEAEIRQLIGLTRGEEEEAAVQSLVINSAQTPKQLVANTASWLVGDDAYQLLMGTRIDRG